MCNLFAGETLAVAWWAFLAGAVIFGTWSGLYAETRAWKERDEAWTSAIRWANKVKRTKHMPSGWTEERWESDKVQAEEILLGDSHYTHSDF